MEKNVIRIRKGMIILGLLFSALLCRLFYIQVMCHDRFETAAESQYEIAVDGIDTRGQIFDRNMLPITGSTSQYYYIIKKTLEDETSDLLLKAAGAVRVSRSSSEYRVYRADNFNPEITAVLKEKYSCYVFCSRSRYRQNQPACHLTGYLNSSEKKGVSGLELMYEQKLAPSGRKLVLTADAAGNILPGISPRIKEEADAVPRDNSLITTIDLSLQRKCESLLTGSAACVVSDARTGEILAMASSPGFDPHNIQEYLNQDGDCLINKALQSAYPPGSVFKLVVAAAALESPDGAAARTFPCTGQATVGGVTVSCATAPEGGHGQPDMYEAMAQSCNCYFVQLGEELGTGRILDMAEKLGFGKPVLENYPEETDGNIPDASETEIWDISNISIGQGEISVTPLQISRMISIIANNGRDVPLKIITEEAVNSSAWTAADYTIQETEAPQIISADTAAKLQEMMRAVMTRGTCSGAGWQVPVWGKSGTAEACMGGKLVKDCWLAGFCDLGTRRFVITVFAEDGVSGSATALPVFRGITDYLAANGDYR